MKSMCIACIIAHTSYQGVMKSMCIACIIAHTSYQGVMKSMCIACIIAHTSYHVVYWYYHTMQYTGTIIPLVYWYYHTISILVLSYHQYTGIFIPLVYWYHHTISILVSWSLCVLLVLLYLLHHIMWQVLYWYYHTMQYTSIIMQAHLYFFALYFKKDEIPTKFYFLDILTNHKACVTHSLGILS